MLIVLAKIPEREWSISPSTFYGQLPDYQSRMLALSTQQMSSSCCWCKSKELGGRGSPRFSCVTPVVKNFSSDFLRAIIPTFRILSDIHSGALLRKQSTALTCSLFPQKASSQMFDWISNAPPIGGTVNVKCSLTASAWNL